MGAAINAWLMGNRDIYIGNATAMRDFRVQLRGNRSVLLFGIYLIVLIGVAVITYASSTSIPGGSIVDAQFRLRSFYQTTMALLGLTVCVVAPGLTATTIVMERQRQSIDLVFSAPVTPKYYLVGKMISSFRYTWMLLVLALPVTAASVVLGGASWSDVLVAYILLSVQGLILTAFALMMSTISSKPVGAIIWTYAATIIYNVAVFALAEIGLTALRFGHGAGSEAPLSVALSPWNVAEAARTYSTVAGLHVPNWLFMVVISLLVTKICLLGAGALLSPSGGKEIVGLRVHSLLYTGAVAGIAGWFLWPLLSSHPPRSVGGELNPSTICGMMVAWCSAAMVTIIPSMACYGYDRERRFQPNGAFALRRILDGTPGGALPFLLAMMTCLFGGFAVGGWMNTSVWLGSHYWVFGFFATAFWVLFWSLGRLVSSFARALKTSRTLVFAAFVMLAALPYPFLAVLAGIPSDSTGVSLWGLYILGPLIGYHSDADSRTMLVGAVMLGLSLLMTCISEVRTRQKLSMMRNYDERPFQPA